MKLIFSLLFSSFLVVSLHVDARGLDEKELAKQAEKMSYSGQLERGEEMLEKMTGAPVATEGGWDMTSLALGLLWGAIGTGYFIFGKKQSRFVFLLCGIGLCVFPLVVSNNGLNLLLGLVLSVLPFKVEL